VQYVIASSLLIATFVVLFQMKYIQNKDLGFDKEQLIYLNSNSDINTKKAAFKSELLNIIDIKNVSFSYASYRLKSEHWSNNDGEKSYACHIEIVDEDYLSTLGIELIHGRDFSENAEFDKDKFLLNESAAKEIFNGKAVGEKIFGGEIIGVVKDYSFETLHKNVEPLAILLDPDISDIINIRIDGEDWPSVIKDIKKTWKDFSPNFPFEYSFVDDYLQSKYKKEQEFSKLFILFSIISILIACLGIIGLISFTIQRKSKEIGIRKVNGANAFKIVLLLSSDLNKLIIYSNIIAMPITWYLMNKWLQGFAYHIQLSIWIFGLSFIIVLLVTFIAISYQSYKASKLNPIDALRYE
jgi:putative ABC transport system permease protein